ncbi:MAG: hypothetical protein JO316_18190 [Abitibacteriaceae bacterium]|nr:hypothetical protein [Abditibacteriaceae bacterium]MBV9867290.1 hypothetical protein [Abditibacteriaceae bacterium]
MYAAALRQRGSSRFSTPLARLAIVLLAVLQFVAPTWHVCELGGSSCCEHQLTTQSLPSITGLTATCGRCTERKGAVSGRIVQARDNCPFTGTCLARLLESMPGSFFALPTLLLPVATRYLSVLTPSTLCSVVALPQPPVRGPPVLAFS